jgi:RNA polymerase sigma-70 factor (ECF subfamily)
MDQFLSSVERRAYRIAKIAVGSHEDALDLVQDAMLALVQKYARRDPEEWPPLFHRILQSRILDFYRRSKVRNRWISWLGFPGRDDDPNENPVDALADEQGREPMQALANQDSMVKLEQALQQLPLRQQQAFLLRTWEGMNVAETARAMKCSEGSVKTHYSRAVHTLREKLEGHWP